MHTCLQTYLDYALQSGKNAFLNARRLKQEERQVSLLFCILTMFVRKGSCEHMEGQRRKSRGPVKADQRRPNLLEIDTDGIILVNITLLHHFVRVTQHFQDSTGVPKQTQYESCQSAFHRVHDSSALHHHINIPRERIDCCGKRKSEESVR